MTEATTQAVEGAPEEPVVAGKPAQMLSHFIACREKRRALKRLFETEDEPLKSLETDLGLWLQKYLIVGGLENIKTAVGTAFLTTKTTASLKDPDEFMKFVTATGKFELLDRKANTTAVRDYLKANGALPPGANLSSIQTVGVHKKVGGKLTEED